MSTRSTLTRAGLDAVSEVFGLGRPAAFGGLDVWRQLAREGMAVTVAFGEYGPVGFYVLTPKGETFVRMLQQSREDDLT